MKLLKNVNDKLVARVNNADTSRFALETKYDKDKSDVEKKISDADKKFFVPVDSLEKQIIMLKLLKKEVQYQVLLVQLLMMH